MRILFHVGLAKAASSSIQSFLEMHPRIAFPERIGTTNVLVPRNALDYDAEALRAYVDRERRAALASEEVLVFSHERLSGNPHSGHYDAAEIALRIREAVPEAEIILCLREQFGLIASCYKQYVRIGGVRTLEDYLEPTWDQRIPLFDWRFYRFDRLIRFYHQAFSRDRVHILLFEELVRNQEAFFSDLCGRIGVRHLDSSNDLGIENPGLPDGSLEHLRLLNLLDSRRTSVRDPTYISRQLGGRLRIRWAARRARRDPKARNVREEVRTRLFGRFGVSNRATEELIGESLPSPSYEIADEAHCSANAP